MYDWANSAFQTTIIATVFPIYYQKVAAAGYIPIAVELTELKRGGGSVKCAVAELRP